MKQYLVEVRLSYDVRADTADEALRLVSPAIQDDETIAVEYSVRERHEPAPQTDPKSPELHGLTKPVYTVTEAASVWEQAEVPYTSWRGAALPIRDWDGGFLSQEIRLSRS